MSQSHKYPAQTGVHVRRRHRGGDVLRRSHGGGFEASVDGLPFAEARDGEQQQSLDIAPEAVDGTVHILPDSLGMDLFAETIVPPRVLGALPALPDPEYPEGSLVFLTTDGKLWRNVSDAWTVEVDGADILANSITAGQIAAGAIAADEIAAGAITTEKFHVGAHAPNVENSTGEVLIDSDGITILNGAITLQDYAGVSVLNSVGFGGSWIDFIRKGTYNGSFVAGTTTAIVGDTIVGTANTVADYLASLSVDVPYWIIDNVALGFGGTLQRAGDVSAPSGMTLRWSGDARGRVIQDVPVVANEKYVVDVEFRHFGVGAFTYDFISSLSWRDETHAIIGAASTLSDVFSQAETEFEDYGHYVLQDALTAPPNASYLRVEFEIGRLTGNPTIRLGGVNLRHVSHHSALQFDTVTTVLQSVTDAGVVQMEVGPAGIAWGDGTNPMDTVLQRLSADTLVIGSDDVLERNTDAWTAVTYTNSWVDFGGALGTVAYRKDAMGYVHLKGVMKNGVIGSSAFTLPAGYRPAADTRYACVSNNAFGVMAITSAGTCTPTVGSNASFSVDGITFRAA